MSRKVLTIDIETSPHLAYTFSTRQAYITPIQVVEPTRMLSFAAKWEGKPQVIFESEYDFESQENYLSPLRDDFWIQIPLQGHLASSLGGVRTPSGQYP